ncbi:hypothetical protein Tco_0179411 [Tanacetum coccineum]
MELRQLIAENRHSRDKVNTPVLSSKEPDNSLSMGDEHLDTILATESDEVIKSSVEDLVPILSESEGIPENMCDVPFHDNSSPLDILKDQFEDFSDSQDDSTVRFDDNSFSIDNINYVEASPPHSELVSLEEVKDFHSKDGELEDDVGNPKANHWLMGRVRLWTAMINEEEGKS